MVSQDEAQPQIKVPTLQAIARPYGRRVVG